MRRLILFLLAALIAACSPQQATEAPLEPLALLSEAAANIREVTSLRMDVTNEGGDYLVYTEYGTVIFRRTQAQYVAPDKLQADVRVIAVGVPIDLDLYSSGLDQWYRAIWTGNLWVNQPWAEGFDPQSLLAEETGFEAALDSVIDLEMRGETTLEDGTPVYHMFGRADGPDVSALTVGMIQTRGVVEIDIYIHREQRLPVRFVIAEPADDENVPEPIVWTIDIFDFNGPANLNVPTVSAEATLEVTEAVSEATA